MTDIEIKQLAEENAIVQSWKEFDTHNAESFDMVRCFIAGYKVKEAEIKSIPKEDNEAWESFIIEIAKYYNGTESEPHIRFADIEIYIPEVIKNLKEQFTITRKTNN